MVAIPFGKESWCGAIFLVLKRLPLTLKTAAKFTIIFSLFLYSSTVLINFMLKNDTMLLFPDMLLSGQDADGF